MADYGWVQKEFTKREIVKIVRELGMKPDRSIRSAQLITTITDDLLENGIPEPQDMSDELFEFLLTIEWINDDGDIIYEEEGGADEEDKEPVVDLDEVDLPACFGFADSRDPACKRCKVFDLCMKERLSVRPECFGLLFDENHPECQACLEANFCRVESDQ